jgi:hypothetical protein
MPKQTSELLNDLNSISADATTDELRAVLKAVAIQAMIAEAAAMKAKARRLSG